MAAADADARYLESRGWVPRGHTQDTKQHRRWLDMERGDILAEPDALIAQRARDAATEEQAWIRFAASSATSYTSDRAAIDADELLAEFRRRRDSGAFGPRSAS